MRYYLGPWQFGGVGINQNAWHPPAGVAGAIDLRSIPAHSTAGIGFFTSPDAVILPSPYIEIARGLIDTFAINPARKTAIANALGIASVSGNTLLEVLRDILTLRADPTGLARWKPLMPTRELKLEIWLGGHSLIWQKQFNLADPEAANVIVVIQENYRKIREDALAGRTRDPEQHRRVLDALGEKYRVSNPEDYFIPGDLPKETRLKHSTTITESFNQADSGTLGPDLTWTEKSGVWATNTNKARKDGGGNNQSHIARADSDLASDDHYSKATLSGFAANAYQGPACRVAANADATFYSAVGAGSDATGQYLIKFVTGTQTNIDTGATARTDGDIWKSQADGSTIKGLVNEVEITNVTDTAITGNLRCGLNQYSESAALTFDNFEAGDLAAGGAQMFLLNPARIDGIGHGGIFPGNRV